MINERPNSEKIVDTSEIHIRDPFILLDNGTYYMYGTTGAIAWSGTIGYFQVHKSDDLKTWNGPFSAFIPPENFWASHDFWAPEVHKYQNNYYMFASFKRNNQPRASQILISKSPLGPFEPLTSSPITPHEWECLDATLYVDPQGCPWTIFCHEWVQCHDGEIVALKLADDLTHPMGDPVLLFKASQAAWSRPHNQEDNINNYVTDGPFIYTLPDGPLIMLWSSMGAEGYAIGQAKSENGILGPWDQLETPIFCKDGGHGMVFRSKENKLMLSIHTPNHSPNERPAFFEMDDSQGFLKVVKNLI